MKRVNFLSLFVLITLHMFATSALAASVDELERRLDIVTQELQSLKNEAAVADDADYSSTYGLGPAASKVYKAAKGLSIGGYGEAHYSRLVSDANGAADEADMLRFILYVGYKFNDSIILNTEVEYEHTDEVAVEMATLDFLFNDAVNLRTGLMLLPIGLTNEMHEPTLFHGNDRPYVEREVLPSTWREMGAGLFGQLAEGLDYKLYLVNGLQGADFTSKGIRRGRQNGAEALANDWALTGSLTYEPTLGLNLGGSFYLGNSGQDEVVDGGGNAVDVFTQIYELHAQYKVAGLELKALGSHVLIDDTAFIAGATVPEKVTGCYGEIAYDILPLLASGTTQYLAPFYRYEKVVTTGSDEDLSLHTAGISYKPIPNVVLKADYRNFDQKVGSRADEVNVGFGFIF